MKRLVKLCAVTGLALSVLALTTPKAQARGGWPIAAGVIGGLAVGTCIGATMVHAAAPVYVYPPVAPGVVYAAPAPQVVVAGPVCAAPVVYGPPCPYYYRGYGYGYGYGRGYYRGGARYGYGWGPRSYYHYRR